MDHYPRQYLYLRAVRAKLFIDNNFASSIDLDKIADEACFSKFHFVRLFRSIYGRTPHQYLTHVRVEKAKEYLDEGQTVAYACFKVGFDSVSSFTGLSNDERVKPRGSTNSGARAFESQWRRHRSTTYRVVSSIKRGSVRTGSERVSPW